MRVKIPMQASLNFVIPDGSDHSASCCIMPWCNTTSVNSSNANLNSTTGQSCGLTGQILFNTYANLFDEVKIDGMRASINMVDAFGQGATYSAIKIGSVIDRLCKIKDTHPTFAEMSNWSTFYNRIILNNGKAFQKRAVWASDLTERITFHDSDITTQSNPVGTALVSWRTDSFTGFAPAIFFAVQLPVVNNTGANVVIHALADITFWVTFRNPKCSVTSVSKAAEMDRLDIDAEVDMAQEKKVSNEDESFEPPAKQKRSVTLMTSE